jgi:hypothetical protein
MVRFLYFVGAGLSKALELPLSPPKRVPLMGDFISVMGDYINEEDVQASLARLVKEGAFASPPKLLAEFAERKFHYEFIDATMLRDVSHQLTELPEQNVETLLTAAPALRQRVIFAVNAIFCTIGWDVEFDPLNRFLRRQFAIPGAKHTFVNFDYDLLLDRSVQLLAPEFQFRWLPKDGYGFAASGTVDSEGKVTSFPAAPEETDLVKHLRRHADPALMRGSDIMMLKPHGSLNWWVPFSGNFEFDDALPAMAQDDESVCYVRKFDRLQDSANWGIFVIPPEPNKSSSFSFIRQTLCLEQEAVQQADEIYVLGWSAPPTDKNQLDLIQHAVERPHSLKSLTVVNYGAPRSCFDLMGDAFGVNRAKVRKFNSGFREFVKPESFNGEDRKTVGPRPLR